MKQVQITKQAKRTPRDYDGPVNPVTGKAMKF